jgi:hypothetical protein
MKVKVFWDAINCSLINSYKDLGGNCCLHPQGKGVKSAENESKYKRGGLKSRVESVPLSRGLLVYPLNRRSRYFLNGKTYQPNHMTSNPTTYYL